MVIFHCYVSSPEGKSCELLHFSLLKVCETRKKLQTLAKLVQGLISTTGWWDLGPLQNCQAGYFVRNLGIGAFYFVAKGFVLPVQAT